MTRQRRIDAARQHRAAVVEDVVLHAHAAHGGQRAAFDLGHHIARQRLLALGVLVGGWHVERGIVEPRRLQPPEQAVDVTAHRHVIDVVERDAEREAGVPGLVGDITVDVERLARRRAQRADIDDVGRGEVVTRHVAVDVEAARRELQVAHLLRQVELGGIAVRHRLLARGDHVGARSAQALLVEVADDRDDREARIGIVISQVEVVRAAGRGLDEGQVAGVLGARVVELERGVETVVAFIIAAKSADVIAVAILAEVEAAAQRHAGQVARFQRAGAAGRAVEAKFVLVALFVVVEFGEDGLGVDALAFLGLVFDAREEAVVPPLDLVLAHVELGRPVGIVGADFAVVGQLLAAIVRSADDETERVVRPRQAQRSLPLLALAQPHETVARVAGDVQALLLHRRIGLEVDRGDDGVGLQVRGQRLVDHHLRKQHGGDRVEAEGAGVAALVHACHRDSVDAYRGPAVRRAAHLDVTLLPLIALHRDGGQARARRRRSGREAADRIRCGDVGKVVHHPLGLDRVLLRRDDRAGDDDVFSDSGIIGGNVRGLLGMSDGSAGEGAGKNADDRRRAQE
ncbi:hypothetical protein ACFSLT_20235 [Novosphingobium resinovorum]